MIIMLQLFTIKLTIKFPSFTLSSLDTPTCTVLLIVKMNPLSQWQRSGILNETVSKFLQIDSLTLKYIYVSFFSFLNRSFGSYRLKRKHNREWKSLRRAIMNICTRECGNKVLNQCKSYTNCWMALKSIEHFRIFNIWKFEYLEMQKYITSGILFANCKSCERSLYIYIDHWREVSSWILSRVMIFDENRKSKYIA